MASRVKERFCMYIRHKKTNELHKMELEFYGNHERERFITEMPEQLECIHYERA